MRSRTPLPLVLAVAVGLWGCGDDRLRGPTFAETVESGGGQLVVLYAPSTGFAHPSEPSTDADEAPRVTGVTAELMKAFATWAMERHGLELTLEFIEEPRWAVFYDRVRAAEGGVFGLGNVTITEARRSELAFSPPYLSNIATLITHEDVPDLVSLSEIDRAFAGKAGLLYPGTLHEARLLALQEIHFPDMESVTVETNDQLVDRAASGDGYFGYIDIYNYWRAVEDGRPLRRHPVGDDASEEFGIIMPLDSDWAPVIEQFFAEHEGVLGTDWYAALLEEHLGPELARLLDGG